MQSNPLREISDAASRALGWHDHFSAGVETPRRTPSPAVASGGVDLLRALDLGATPDGVYRLDARKAGETQALDPRAVIEAHSRCVAAGARLIVAAPAPTPPLGDGIVLYRQEALVRSTDPAAFATVADGAAAVDSALPFHDASFQWQDAPSIAFSATITRPQHRAVGGDQLLDDLMISILAGLGEAADKSLLAAIAATAPAAFSFGLAAARHLTYDRLRALIGTNGTGAIIAGDGSFRANPGVQAELTAAHTGTFIGAFGRSAVAIRPELQVHFKRLDVNGSQEVTVFANVQAIVPDAGSFWTVTA